jgi:hypothetical protein
MNTKKNHQPGSTDYETRCNIDQAIAFENVFTVIFNGATTILGDISSVGIACGEQPKTPDHMLVIFEDDAYGFQQWQSDTPVRWHYRRSDQTLVCTGNDKPLNPMNDFQSFLHDCLTAITDQKVTFSKNIGHHELVSL